MTSHFTGTKYTQTVPPHSILYTFKTWNICKVFKLSFYSLFKYLQHCHWDLKGIVGAASAGPLSTPPEGYWAGDALKVLLRVSYFRWPLPHRKQNVSLASMFSGLAAINSPIVGDVHRHSLNPPVRLQKKL